MSGRKVHFSVPLATRVEYLDRQWETASRLARDGSEYILMGLDRQRFRLHIERTGEVLNKIFDLDLRQRIYKERFENFVIPEQQAAKSSRDSESTKEAYATSDSETDSTTAKATAKQNIAAATTTVTIEHSETSTASAPRQNNCQNKKSRRRSNKKSGRRRRHRGAHRRKK